MRAVATKVNLWLLAGAVVGLVVIGLGRGLADQPAVSWPGVPGLGAMAAMALLALAWLPPLGPHGVQLVLLRVPCWLWRTCMTVLALAAWALLLAAGTSVSWLMVGVVLYGVLHLPLMALQLMPRVPAASTPPVVVAAPVTEAGAGHRAQSPTNTSTNTPAQVCPDALAELLRSACREGDETTFYSCLGLVSAVDGCDHFGRSALIYAADRGQLRMVETLLQRGANCNLRDGYGRSAIDEALTHSHLDVARLLFKAGADLLGCNAEGRPLLHRVVAELNPEVVTWLLMRLKSAGVDLNLTDPAGQTALMVAARGELFDEEGNGLAVVRLLVAAGVDLWRQDSEGRTALDHARIGDSLMGESRVDEAIVAWLEERMAQPEEPS